MTKPISKHIIGSTGNEELDDRVWKLVRDIGCDQNQDLIVEMIFSALRMAQDQTSTADLKLFNRALKEMYTSSKVFEPYAAIRKIAVFGSARTAHDAPDYKAAEAFSRLIKDHGYMVITGGGEGIMGAAQHGAERENSFGLNIRLPFEQRANPTIEGDRKLIQFNYFFTRKLAFLKETHAIALFPGGFGTMDEGFEALTLLQTGKSRLMPIIMVSKQNCDYWDTWMNFISGCLLHSGLISESDFHLFRICKTIEEAVQEVLQFYKLFHSSRWVREQLVIRLNRPLHEDSVKKLNDDFGDLLVEGEIVQATALKEERSEPDIFSLRRIILTPNRKNFGRIRQLIDAINLSKTE